MSSSLPPPSRPQTAHSIRAPSVRPPSTRPGTSLKMDDMGDWICAVYQSGGNGSDIGIALFDTISGNIVVTQLVDGRTFSKTLHHLFLHPPTTLLVPENAVASSSLPSNTLPSGVKRTFYSRNISGGRNRDEPSLLVQSLEGKLDVECEAMVRGAWNRDEGFEKISEYITADDQKPGVIMTIHAKYFALGAASALFRYLATRRGIGFAASSQRIIYKAAEGTVFIDPDSARNLEVVSNVLTMKSKSSLLGVLNRTQTKMGFRMLKSTLLQPSTVPEIIENRLDAVEELMRSDTVLKELKERLKAISAWDLDKIISQITQIPSRTDAQDAERRLGHLLSLRSVIKALAPVAEMLGKCRSDLLKSACKRLNDKRTAVIEELLDEKLNEDALAQPGKALNQKALKMYAVKSDFDTMLDVARGTYKENVEDIHEFLEEIKEKHNLPFSLYYRETGFILTLPKEALGDASLPPGFRLLNVQRSGKNVAVTHASLLKLNSRMKESQSEAFLMSDALVNELLADVVQHVACLYPISEALARLDMLTSFAQVAVQHQYCRPEFTNTQAIRHGKHPILAASTYSECIPNDTYLATDSNAFHVIQGANMAGKSTYLRQVALITIMASCGSYVPAFTANIRIPDAILTRLSNDDSIERSLSTFAQEMATSAMILSHATRDSLIIIDELGRGTAPSEGMAICQAIAEELIRRKSYVLFATHFRELAETLKGFPPVEVLQLYSEVKRSQASDRFSTVYHYKIMKGGLEKEEHYGLELAKLAELPEHVLETAKNVAYELDDRQKQGKASSDSVLVTTRRKILITLRARLVQIVRESRLSDNRLREMLQDVRMEAVGELKQALKEHREAVEELQRKGEDSTQTEDTASSGREGSQQNRDQAMD